MVSIRTDGREIQAEPDPEAERIAAETAREYLDVRLRLARALLRIERCRAFHLSACSSVVQYAVRLGVPAAEARVLVDLGRAIDAVPADLGAAAVAESIEDLVRSGRIATANAGQVGRLLREPGLVRPGEDWVQWARTLRPAELRRRVNERIEQAAQGEPEVVTLEVAVSPQARGDFRRAQVIASRDAGRPLTQGEAFTLIVRRFLDVFDETLQGAGTRRVGPTSETPGDRYVPAEVRRAVRRRSGDRCEVPGCTNDIFLELAHVERHAAGGDREERNLLHLCHTHHVLFDAGVLLLAGWDAAGRPRFRDRRGRDLARRPRSEAAPRDGPEAEAPGDVGERGGPPEPPAVPGPRPGDSVVELANGANGSPQGGVAGAFDADSHDGGVGGESDDGSGPMRVSERPPPDWVSDVPRAFDVSAAACVHVRAP